VTLQSVGFSATVRALCICVTIAPLLSSCALFSPHRTLACTQRQFQGSTVSGKGLIVPAGMSAPDTRNGVKIPALTEAEVVRPSGAACLQDPPSFAAGEGAALPSRNTLPGQAPAPVVLPLPDPLPPPLPAPAVPPVVLPSQPAKTQ
jgi:hypothetical protein